MPFVHIRKETIFGVLVGKIKSFDCAHKLSSVIITVFTVALYVTSFIIPNVTCSHWPDKRARLRLEMLPNLTVPFVVNEAILFHSPVVK